MKERKQKKEWKKPEVLDLDTEGTKSTVFGIGNDGTKSYSTISMDSA